MPQRLPSLTRFQPVIDRVRDNGISDAEMVTLALEVGRASSPDQASRAISAVYENYSAEFDADVRPLEKTRDWAVGISRLTQATGDVAPLPQAWDSMGWKISDQTLGLAKAAIPDKIRITEARDIVEHVLATSTDPVGELSDLSIRFHQDFTPAARQALYASIRDASDAGPRPSALSAALMTELGATKSLLRDSIAELSNRRDGLRGEIALLELSHERKSREIDSLVSSIEARKQEVQEQYRRKRNIGIFGALMGVPALAYASVFAMMDDDARLNTLKGELAKAQSDQTRIASQLSTYKGQREAIDRQLSSLEAAEKRLSVPIEPALQVPPDLRSLSTAIQEEQRLASLKDNLSEQVVALTHLRDAAASLGVELDGIISRLNRVLAAADQAVEASQKQTFELLEAVVSPDPQQAAQKWLDRRVGAELKRIKRELGLDMNVYIRQMVADVFPHGGPGADLLAQQLRASLT